MANANNTVRIALAVNTLAYSPAGSVDRRTGKVYEESCVHLTARKHPDIDVKANVQGDAAIAAMFQPRLVEVLKAARTKADAENAKLQAAWDAAKATDPATPEPKWLSARLNAEGTVFSFPEGWWEGPVVTRAMPDGRIAKSQWINAPGEERLDIAQLPTLSSLMAG